jgi:predicted permease
MKETLERLAQDLKYGARMLRRSRAVTAVAVLSLALGIGANTAILSLIESTLLRPVALKNSSRLRMLSWRSFGGGWEAPNIIGNQSPTFGWVYEQRDAPGGGYVHAVFSPSLYAEFLRDNRVFDSLFGFKEIGRLTAVVDGGAEPVSCFLVSGSFYHGVEVVPVIGRPIQPSDDVPTQDAQVALISYDYWTRRFARSSSVLGKTILLNDLPVTIIGVNPEYFTGVQPGSRFDVWAPLHLPSAVSPNTPLDRDKVWAIPMMGRLKPGVSDEQARSAMDALFQAQLDADYPGFKGTRPKLLLQSGARGLDYLTQRYEQPMFALLGLAGLVLLIACANVANLLLAKSAVRQREISLRLALGARPARIVRQLLTEGLLLASMAGIAGLILGYWTRNAIPALVATPWKPNPFDTAFDPKVLLASLAITFLTGVLFSLAPVCQAWRVTVNDALKEGARSSASLSKLRLGRLLVVLQVALSVLLLAGAGLCLETFRNLKNEPLGFRPDGVLLFALDPPRLRYPADKIGLLLIQVQDRLNAIPGVQSATFSGDRSGDYIPVDGQRAQQNYESYASLFSVGSRFTETMGIPILYGRGLEDRDRLSGARSVVVNQEFARRFFHRDNVAAETFTGFTGTRYQIVGVCENWREQPHGPVRPSFYGISLQPSRVGSTFAVKIADGEAGIVKRIPEAVTSVDPQLTVAELHTEQQQIDDTFSQERLMASLAGLFGVMALILAAIGIYGVMAYAVARRTNEIGIRMALGAKPEGVAWMVLRESLLTSVAGVALGVSFFAGAIPLLNRSLAPAYWDGFTYGVKPQDPLNIAVAVAVLVAAGALAGCLPARRAASVDPMAALRHE